MAKRKNPQTAGAESSVPADITAGNHDHADQPGRQDHAVEDIGGLAEEVQSFLSRRSELARKLTQEIEATEKKLAELKRTAALLFPPAGNGEGEKERQERKPKKVPAGRPVKAEREVVSEDKQLRIETMDVEPAAPETPNRPIAENGPVAEDALPAEADAATISSPA